MASVSSAILCDFAQVRESLLFVSSGALTRRYCPQVPVPMGMMLAAIVDIPYVEVSKVHELSVSVKRVETAEVMGRATAGFQVGVVDIEPGESLYVPVPINVQTVMLQDFGAYDVQLSIDGSSGHQLTFYVRPLPEVPQPPT